VPSDLRNGPAAPPLAWEDGVHDLQQQLAAAAAAAGEVRSRGRLRPTPAAPAVQGLRGIDPELDRMHVQGWTTACALYEALAGGTRLPPVAVPSLAPEPDEIVLAEDALVCSWFYATDRQSEPLDLEPGGALLGLTQIALNLRMARLEATVNAAQWRDHRNCQVVVTSKRIACELDGIWLSYLYADLIEFTPDVVEATFVARYHGSAPVLFAGPAAPALAVMAATALHGVRGLGLPAFAPLVMAVAGRRRRPAGGAAARSIG
jgi:hypothetical protein